DSISYLFSAGFLASISPEEPPTETGERGHVVAGIKYVLRNRTMRASLLATATINLFNFAFHALFILYAVRSLHVRPGTLGLVLGAGAVGGLNGSVAAKRVQRRADRIGREESAQPPHRDRAGVLRRVRALPGPAAPRPAGGRAEVARA